MSDLSRHLPLSQRESVDESGVSSDWSQHIARTLLGLAPLLESLAADAWDGSTLRDGYSVRDAAGHLLWRLATPRAARARQILRRVASTRQAPRHAVLYLSREASEAGGVAAARGIRSLAGTIAASGAHRGIGDLSVAVVDAWDIARSVGLPLSVDPIASGAVALARSLSAPAPLRSVVRGRRLVATDADWVLGRGVDLQATAADIVLFLWGRAGVPRAAPPG